LRDLKPVSEKHVLGGEAPTAECSWPSPHLGKDASLEMLPRVYRQRSSRSTQTRLDAGRSLEDGHSTPSRRSQPSWTNGLRQPRISAFGSASSS